MSLLQVQNLTKTFPGDDCPVVNDVTFTVEHGQIFVLVGPSGCGKTTTLRIIAGFEWPDNGSVTLDGKPLVTREQNTPPEQRGIGFVFQDYALFPHLNVCENVMYGLNDVAKEQRRDRAHHVINMVGLGDMCERGIHDLSGGQQQRVALARSIAPHPSLILLDEPFSNLDAALRETTRNEIRRVLNDAGMSAILVTHDQEEAMSFGDRIAVMHEGRLEQVGAPEQIYHRPATDFVADFLGQTNLVTAAAAGEYADTPLGRVRLQRPAQGDVTISMRPEHLRMEPPRPGSPQGKIIHRQFKGHDLTYRVRMDGHVFTVQTDYRCPFVRGDHVHLFPVEHAVVVKDATR